MLKISKKGERLSLNLIVNDSLTDKEEKIIRDACDHIAMVMNTEDFETFVLKFKYSYTSCRGALWWKKCYVNWVDGFNWNSGMSNQEIYNKIMTGKEDLRPEADNEIDITLEVDRRNKRGVLGYTYPNSTKQWIYSWFLNTDAKRVAGNLVHEWCHKMGFDHAFKSHYTRQFTVPYAVGYYVSNYDRQNTLS